MLPGNLPAVIRQNPKRRAEAIVFDALRDGTAPGYRVFYSFCWVNKIGDSAAFEGEADFIVAHPDYGILVLEVKGGRIDHDARSGQWTSTDGQGHAHTIDPVAQARRSKYALIHKLKGIPAWGDRWAEVNYAIVFPDCHKPPKPLPADLPGEIVIFKNDLANLEGKLQEIHAYWCGNRPGKSIGNDGLKVLTDVIAPDVHLRARLGEDLRAESKTLLRLTEEQYRVLELLRWAPRVAVSGGAGTGKTFLALRKAELAATKEGRKTLLVCYNHTLADHLKAAAPQDSRLTVCTFHQLCHQLAAQVGIELAAPDAQRLPPRFFEQELPLALVDAIAENPKLRFEAVVVDEGQDFLPAWWSALEMAITENPGVLYVFYDDNQRVYPSRVGFPTGLVPIALTHNLRNTKRVFEAARPYYAGQEMCCDGPDGRVVEFVSLPRSGMIEREVGKLLHRLVRDEGVEPQQVAVLTLDGSSLLYKTALGAFTACSAPGVPHRVVVDSVRRFKGLERDVVLLVLSEAISQDELLYVAITRARTHLIVLGPQAAIAAAQQAT
jgi:hypothetical protein